MLSHNFLSQDFIDHLFVMLLDFSVFGQKSRAEDYINHPIGHSMETSIPYLYDEVGRGDVPGEGAEVDPDSPLLMGCQLGIVLVIQGDPGKGPGDGGRVTGVHLLEYD